MLLVYKNCTHFNKLISLILAESEDLKDFHYLLDGKHYKFISVFYASRNNFAEYVPILTNRFVWNSNNNTQNFYGYSIPFINQQYPVLLKCVYKPFQGIM